MTHIKKFESIFNDKSEVKSKSVIKHYFVREQMEVKDLVRKQGDGKSITINNIGTILEIKDWDDSNDIAYLVEFPIELEHGSPFSKEKYKTSINQFYVFHNKDAKNIVRVF